MKNYVIGVVLTACAVASYSADERTAAAVAKKYSEAIACQLVEKEFQRNQYKAVKVVAGDKDLGGLGDLYVVYWEGDSGCSGGNGTVQPNFTVLEQRGFSSVDPVVVTDYQFPELELVRLTSLTGKNGQLQISGVMYGPTDNQGVPTKKVSYTLRFDPEKSAFLKR